MLLLLIRHGETRRVESETGIANPALTAHGHWQARRLADWLRATELIAHIAVSPLQRARQTAEPLLEEFGLEPEVIPGLAEFDARASSYIPMEEMRAKRDPRFRAMIEGRWEDFGGEIQPKAFRRSVVDTLNGLAATHPAQTVAVVCHGAVINAYLGDVIGTPRLLWFEPRYTSMHRVLVSRRGVRSVETVNECTHLQASG
ncbi:MAG: histidine phosphatase family protein [Acidimicrobiales bacterium]